ncbi:hypothetical protein FB451DRAFT_1184075 [Mycena latifolia]|nr:hypothetical protein FB451DRAFT_1184075 [Mycena latifolia]
MALVGNHRITRIRHATIADSHLASIPPSRRNMSLASLRNPLRRRRRAQVIARSLSLLPLEVWELILEELTDEGLLAAARVCSAFNDRCIAIHLSRNGITPESFSTGTLNIHSHLLPVLQLSRLTPKFIPSSVTSNNLLNAHTIDTIVPYSQRALLTEFCNVVRAMVEMSAETILLSSPAIYNLRAPVMSRTGACDTSTTGNTVSGALNGSTSHLHSVEVRTIPAAADGTGPFTLIFFETNTTKDLEFGRFSWSSEAAVPSAQLTKIIPYLTLPVLRTLRLKEDNIIQERDAHGLEDPPPVGPLQRKLLTTAPIALPALAHLRFVDYIDILQSPIDDEERRIVGCLYGVRRVCILAREMAEVQPLVTWLAMLPALNRLEVTVYSWRAEASATTSALEEMRATLPWVPEIEVISALGI